MTSGTPSSVAATRLRRARHQRNGLTVRPPAGGGRGCCRAGSAGAPPARVPNYGLCSTTCLHQLRPEPLERGRVRRQQLRVVGDHAVLLVVAGGPARPVVAAVE